MMEKPIFLLSTAPNSPGPYSDNNNARTGGAGKQRTADSFRLTEQSLEGFIMEMLSGAQMVVRALEDQGS